MAATNCPPTKANPIGYPTKEQFEKLKPLLDGRITKQPICKECQQVNCQCRAVLLKENKPEQPNTELLIIKTIQGLMTCVSNELEKLPQYPPKITNKQHKNYTIKAKEEIDLFEKTTLYELQKAFE